jgi:hypothetical protein
MARAAATVRGQRRPAAAAPRRVTRGARGRDDGGIWNPYPARVLVLAVSVHLE